MGGFDVVQKVEDRCPHFPAAFVLIPFGVTEYSGFGPQPKAGQDDLRGFPHSHLAGIDYGINFLNSRLNQDRIVDWGHTMIPPSVARQQANLSISAALACIGKFLRLRGFTSAVTWTRQSKTVNNSPRSMAWAIAAS